MPTAVSPARAALGGPVILGGDDLTDHGSISGGVLQNGWLYIRKALENLNPQVTIANNNTVAVLGSADSTSTAGNAGGAYHYAVPQAGMTALFFDGAASINSFFVGLANGTYTPSIIVTAGNGAANNLDASEGTALSSNAVAIANFVNAGGGLLSHGSGTVSYGWLTTLLPGINFTGSCSTPLTLTAAGQAAFPGLTNGNISSGPCHNSFSGNLGGLQVLATDTLGRNAIIGGAAAQLPGSISLTPSTATNTIGVTNSHTVTALVKDANNNPLNGILVTFTVTSGPNAGATGTATTNSSGLASFTWSTNGTPGTDLVQGSFVDPVTNTTKTSPSAQKTWQAPPNTAPTPNGGWPYTVPEGGSVTLSGSCTDPDAGQTCSFAWDLDNNGSYETPGQTATFSAATLDGPSIHTVGLQACDNGTPSLCGTASGPVNVTNVAPSANAGPDQTQYWGLPVTFNGSLSDPGVPDTHTATWTFGDGSPAASGLNASHPYANPGGYTATLTVTDDDGGAGTDTALATINKRGTSLAYTGATQATFGYAATLSAQLTDSVDPGTAQLGGKTITFLVDGTISVAGTTNASGVASATLAPLPPLMPGAHTIAVSFAGDSHYLASAAQASLQVSNTANGKVTAGTLRAANNGRGGFNVQADATGATVKGELQFQNNSLNFHAPTMTALGVAPDKKSAWFAGTGRDGQAFVAYVEDNGEPGANDIYKLWVAGTPQNGTGALTGGNVQIH